MIKLVKKIFRILFLPFAIFAHFTWRWWEKLWKGGLFKKSVYVALLPLYGILFIVLNITQK